MVFKTGVKTLNKRIVTKKQLVENIKSKKTTNKLDTVLSPKVLAYSLSENFNKQFSGLNKEEKELISEIITLKTEDLDKNFIENKDSVIVKINKLVKESDDDNLITRLIETKNKVITMNSSKLSLLKLKQLKNDLNY